MSECLPASFLFSCPSCSSTCCTLCVQTFDARHQLCLGLGRELFLFELLVFTIDARFGEIFPCLQKLPAASLGLQHFDSTLVIAFIGSCYRLDLSTGRSSPIINTNAISSASTKEQKQILADIQSGSQKFGRRLTRPSVQKREKSGDNIVPVTVLGDAPEQQQERRGRRSLNSQRPGLPKRTSSMKRAYNYFFGGGQPAPVPSSPTAPVTTTDTTAPSKVEDAPRENGIDTPPETPREAQIPGGEDRIGMSCAFLPTLLPNNHGNSTPNTSFPCCAAIYTCICLTNASGAHSHYTALAQSRR